MRPWAAHLVYAPIPVFVERPSAAWMVPFAGSSFDSGSRPSPMSTASVTVRKAAPGIALLARAGYAAKGIVYIVIGALAARAAAGAGGATTDQRGAIDWIGDGPFGTVALVVIGVGLLGYMAWRLVAAATDAESDGDDPTSLGKRLASAGRGLAYGALGVTALRAARGGGDAGGGVARTRDWTSRLLDLPLGVELVVAAGLGVIAYAGYQMYRAGTDRVKKHLDLHEAGPTAATWIVRVGRFGIAARAVVFFIIGAFLVKAGLDHDSSQAGGIAQSLETLAGAPFGRVALGVVALGLVAYGAYQLATARYRRIRAVG
jgi:hypothetical protein